MSHKILFVEDSKEYQLMVDTFLGTQYEITFVDSAEKAVSVINNHTFDLFLVDVVLPGMSGLQLCNFIKSQKVLSTIPLILLTSKDSTDDKVQGFNLGANDYITKPFDFRELEVRIKAQLRNINRNKDSLAVPGLTIDLNKQKIFSIKSSKDIDLTKIEFKLFLYFCQRIDHVLSRQQILDGVWSNDFNVSERTIDSHVSNLRKKIAGTGIDITSVHGCGYRCSLEEKKVA